MQTYIFTPKVSSITPYQSVGSNALTNWIFQK